MIFIYLLNDHLFRNRKLISSKKTIEVVWWRIWRPLFSILIHCQWQYDSNHHIVITWNVPQKQWTKKAKKKLIQTTIWKPYKQIIKISIFFLNFIHNVDRYTEEPYENNSISSGEIFCIFVCRDALRDFHFRKYST